MDRSKDKPLYEEFGGFLAHYLILISVYATWPLARLQVFPDYLEIRVWPGILLTRKIWKNEVKVVKQFKFIPIFREGILIKKPHRLPFSWITFMRFDPNDLLSKLEKAGYPVERNCWKLKSMLYFLRFGS